VPTSSTDDRSLVLSTVASLLAELPPALARALPACLPIIVHGMQVRANIRMAVHAIEANHDLRTETTEYILGVLERHGGQMSQGLRDAYLAAVLRLTDAGFYDVPWSELLRGR